MSYVTPEKREVLDRHIDDLLNALRELESDDPENAHCSNLSYVFLKMLFQSYAHRYTEINEAIGVLECCKLELYRKVAVPFQAQAEFENGTIS